MPVIAHLTASTFYGGPERQMLGLAQALPPAFESVFLSFAEGGRCHEFLSETRAQGFPSVCLRNDTPRLRAATRELATLLRQMGADVLCTHGYKADVVGLRAARCVKIPVIAVSRGWTGAGMKLRCYELLDRMSLRWMDRVVCVSAGQAKRVRRSGVARNKVRVIHNCVSLARFAAPAPAFRDRLLALFPKPPRRLVVTAGRLSPEKGIDVLIRAAQKVVQTDAAVGFIVFGDGPLKEKLQRQIRDAKLQDQFVLGGYRQDLDQFLPHFDLVVLPSFTEGLPNIVLEAFAAGVPVVASAVGGTPELVNDGHNGFLVPAGDWRALARCIQEAMASETGRRNMGMNGQRKVRQEFSFGEQCKAYQQLFDEILSSERRIRMLQKTG